MTHLDQALVCKTFPETLVCRMLAPSVGNFVDGEWVTAVSQATQMESVSNRKGLIPKCFTEDGLDREVFCIKWKHMQKKKESKHVSIRLASRGPTWSLSLHYRNLILSSGNETRHQNLHHHQNLYHHHCFSD